MQRFSPYLLAPVLAALTLAAGTIPVRAQSPGFTAPPGLNLSPAQQARAKTVAQQYAQKMMALQADKAMTPAQKTAQLQTLVKSRETAMMAILTPAQRTQVMSRRQTMLSQQQAFMKAHGSELKSGQALAAQLNKSLTPAQKAQLAAVQKQMTQESQALMANKSLSPQAKMQQLQSEGQAKILAVLNPAQKAEYLKIQQMRKQLMSEAGGQPRR